eukprot:Clim_evm20s198 gene=Clim_evmTU20s198
MTKTKSAEQRRRKRDRQRARRMSHNAESPGSPSAKSSSSAPPLKEILAPSVVDLDVEASINRIRSHMPREKSIEKGFLVDQVLDAVADYSNFTGPDHDQRRHLIRLAESFIELTSEGSLVRDLPSSVWRSLRQLIWPILCGAKRATVSLKVLRKIEEVHSSHKDCNQIDLDVNRSFNRWAAYALRVQSEEIGDQKNENDKNARGTSAGKDSESVSKRESDTEREGSDVDQDKSIKESEEGEEGSHTPEDLLKTELRESLRRVLIYGLREAEKSEQSREQRFHYFQGLHDVCGVLILAVGEESAAPLAADLIRGPLHLAAGPDLKRVVSQLRHLRTLLALEDYALYATLERGEVDPSVGVLGWVLTWFAYVIDSVPLLCSFYDATFAVMALERIEAMKAVEAAMETNKTGASSASSTEESDVTPTGEDDGSFTDDTDESWFDIGGGMSGPMKSLLSESHRQQIAAIPLYFSAALLLSNSLDLQRAVRDEEPGGMAGAVMALKSISTRFNEEHEPTGGDSSSPSLKTLSSFGMLLSKARDLRHRWPIADLQAVTPAQSTKQPPPRGTVVPHPTPGLSYGTALYVRERRRFREVSETLLPGTSSLMPVVASATAVALLGAALAIAFQASS